MVMKIAPERTLNSFNKETNALALALGYRDKATYLHSFRVAELAIEIGLKCGLSGKQLEILQKSAIFHDVGNVGIPDTILIKPAKLNKVEFSSIRLHTEIGEHILEAANFEGCDDVAHIIRHHHEFFDGSGYPDGLVGPEIPVYSRIIGIADSYDAMAYPRIYSLAKSHRQIMEILFQESGVKHDPYFLEMFSHIIDGSHYKARIA
jgi:HD-GYP domain-containing protein (c-di-GMP phosphodiesterase class II)